MFISFEGIDGAGKTTQIAEVKKWLESRGKEVILVREPGGTDFSEEIRNILLNKKIEINSTSELMLFEAARADLCEKVIRPALDSGKIVLTDRFFDSTTAYQGYGRGLDIHKVQAVNEFAVGKTRPNITFYLRISLETSALRSTKKIADRIESSGRKFFERVLAGFEEIAKSEPKRFKIIDSEGTPEQTKNAIISYIAKLI